MKTKRKQWSGPELERLMADIRSMSVAIAEDRGFGAEEHVLRSFEEIMRVRRKSSGSHLKKELPWWFLGIRRSTSQEDHLEKVDFVVTTADVRFLYLQIKSSRAGVEKFSSRRYHKDIATVIIRRDMTYAQVRAKVLRALAVKRERYLRKHHDSQPWRKDLFQS